MEKTKSIHVYHPSISPKTKKLIFNPELCPLPLEANWLNSRVCNFKENFV